MRSINIDIFKKRYKEVFLERYWEKEELNSCIYYKYHYMETLYSLNMCIFCTKVEFIETLYVYNRNKFHSLINSCSDNCKRKYNERK